MSLPAPPDPARVLASMAPAALVLAPGGVVAMLTVVDFLTDSSLPALSVE